MKRIKKQVQTIVTIGVAVLIVIIIVAYGRFLKYEDASLPVESAGLCCKACPVKKQHEHVTAADLVEEDHKHDGDEQYEDAE